MRKRSVQEIIEVTTAGGTPITSGSDSDREKRIAQAQKEVSKQRKTDQSKKPSMDDVKLEIGQAKRDDIRATTDARKRDQERSENRKSQIGSGDRSERIRTYNFPQGRVTDHRINLTLHKLEEFLNGDIHEEMNENLRLKDQDLKLKNLS